MKITSLKAIKAINSRAESTIKVCAKAGNLSAVSSVPGGRSIGSYEAVDLPADDAVKSVNEIIAPALLGKNLDDQRMIDYLLLELDGMPNKSKLGGNAILGTSMAVARLSAAFNNLELFQYLMPLFEKAPERCDGQLNVLMNFINGGAHSKKGADFQEFLVLAKSHDVVVNIWEGVRLYQVLRDILKENVGDEGGFVIGESNNQYNLAVLRDLLRLSLVKNNSLGLDVAAQQLYREDKKDYYLRNEDAELNAGEMIENYVRLVSEFNIAYLEDPFNENDFDSFAKLQAAIGDQALIVGDDLTATNVKRIKTAVEKKACGGFIVKPNQIGTLTETVEAINLIHHNGLKVIISHRSGDTCDDFVSDLAVACGAWGAKFGAPARGERVSKYNRLLEIFS